MAEPGGSGGKLGAGRTPFQPGDIHRHLYRPVHLVGQLGRYTVAHGSFYDRGGRPLGHCRGFLRPVPGDSPARQAHMMDATGRALAKWTCLITALLAVLVATLALAV